jgi:uncharacterized damage-inducible protein DinB
MAATMIENSGEAQARRLENVYEQTAAWLRQPDVAQRLRAGGENEWSAMQILGHLVEMIPYWLSHCHTIITATEPPVFGRSLDAPERLAGVEHGAAGEPDQVLDALHEAVQSAGQTIRAMSPADRNRKGMHASRGEMTVAEIIETFIVVHAESHLAQLQAALRLN